MCSNCGGRIDLPPGFTKPRIRCAECGVYNDVPSHLRDQPAASNDEPIPTPVKMVPSAQPDRTDSTDDDGETYSLANDSDRDRLAPNQTTSPNNPSPLDDDPEREVLIQGTEDDDLNPYTVYDDAPSKLCPKCSRRLPKKAVVCTNCGYDFLTQKTVKRRYEPIHREWESHWPLRQRIVAFVVLQIVNFIALVLVLTSERSPTTMIVTVISAVFLQAFLCGTFDRLEIHRTSKGKVTLRSHWRIAFYPVMPRDIPWRDFEGVSLVQSNEFDPIDWVMAFVLLGYGILPGVLFWYYVIHRDKFAVMLCRGHGFPDTPIFRTIDEKTAMQVRDAVHEITGLTVHN
jgi:ribosomal protein L40E